MPQSCVDGAAPGSRGNTAVEMAKALHFGAEPTDGRLHGAFGELVSQMNAAGEKKGYQLSAANALWGQHDHNWADKFKKENTQDLPFTLASGEKVKTPTMRQNLPFSYMQGNERPCFQTTTFCNTSAK